MAGNKVTTSPRITGPDGARAALAAFRTIRAQIWGPRPDYPDTLEGHEANRARILSAFTELGDGSPFLFGVLYAVAEYAEACMGSSVPELSSWKPTLAKTDAARAKDRRELEELYAEEITS